MNQARMWCVVNPTIGLPLLFAGIAVTSLIVHASVLTHTTWFGAFWQGSAKEAKVSSLDTAPKNAAFTITVTPQRAAAGKTETAFVVTVAPNAAVPAAQPVKLAQAK
jgi:light-harvesting protein B-800-850 alpha chain